MWGNLSRAFSTNWTVICTSFKVDSAFLMCRLSCFLISFSSYVFTEVSYGTLGECMESMRHCRLIIQVMQIEISNVPSDAQPEESLADTHRPSRVCDIDLHERHRMDHRRVHQLLSLGVSAVPSGRGSHSKCERDSVRIWSCHCCRDHSLRHAEDFHCYSWSVWHKSTWYKVSLQKRVWKLRCGLAAVLVRLTFRLKYYWDVVVVIFINDLRASEVKYIPRQRMMWNRHTYNGSTS